MSDTPRANALLTDLISGEKSVEGFATLIDKHEREKALYVLLALLTDPNPRLRIRATQALGSLGDKRAVDALINSLDDRAEEFEEELFEAKFSALAALGASEAIQPLLIHRVNREYDWIVCRMVQEFDREDMLRVLSDAAKHGDRLIRYSVFNTLGYIDDSRSVSLLLEALGEDAHSIRRESLTALIRLKALAAVPVLIQHTLHPDLVVQWQAADALGEFGDPQAIPALLPLLNDNNYEGVRFGAAMALGKLGNPAGVNLIHAYFAKDPSTSFRAVGEVLRVFQGLGMPVMPLFITLTKGLLEAPVPEVWKLRSIAEILAEQGDADALPLLDRMLKSDDETLRITAQQAIDHIKGNRAERNDE